MKVAIFGGTGFVGNYIVDECLHSGHEPHVMSRPENASKLIQSNKCVVYSGHIENETVIQDMINNADAVIYNIGLIREFPKQGITFEKMHYDGVKRTVRTAENANVKRYILMSANGVKIDGTAYQTTKYLSEQLLKNSTLDWTIFRPSLIFGDPRGTVEFCTQLKKDMLSLPIPAPLFFKGIDPRNAGSFAFNPIHVKDVAKCFIYALENDSTNEKIFEVGGTIMVSWKELINTISSAYYKKKWSVPAPVLPVKMLASIFGRFPWFPITADQLSMLMEGNSCSAKVLEDFGIQPIPFETKQLLYLNE